MCRSELLELPVPRVEPNPTILPPVVDVVRNHASTESRSRPPCDEELYAREELLVPRKRSAPFGSSSIAPSWLRTTPLPAVRSEKAVQSRKLPEVSPRRQKEFGASAS